MSEPDRGGPHRGGPHRGGPRHGGLGRRSGAVDPRPVRALEADQYGSGPPVVLLHGQPGSAPDWQRVAERLEGDFWVLVPDRPGYGRTAGPATGFAGNATAIVGLLDRLGIQQAVAVGHSWGGGAALALAQLYPDRVAGLVLAASVGPGEHLGWTDRVLAAPVVGEALAALTIGTTGLVLGSSRFQSLADQRLAGRAREAVKALARLTGAGSGARVWQSFVVEQRALLAELEELSPRLALVAAPTVVVNGDADRIVPPEVSAHLASVIPGATHQVVAGAHHLLPLYHPDAIAGAVRDVARRAGL